MELQLTGRAATAVEVFVDGGRGGTPKLTAFTVILCGNVGDDAAQVRFLRAIAFLLLTHRNGRLRSVLIAKNQTKVLVCVSRPLLRPILLILSQGAQHKHAVSRTVILLDDFRRPFRIGELLNGSVRRIAEQVVGAFFDDPTHEAFANKPAVGPEYDGGVGIMLTEEVDDFLIDFLEHGTSILTASIQRNVHGEVVDEDHHGHQAVVTIMTGELFVFLVAVNVGRGAVDVDPKDVRMLGGVMHEQVLEHLLHGRQRVALQRVFKVAERRTAGCGAQPHGRQKGRIIVDGVVVIQVFLADQNVGQTLDEVAELSASATTLLVGKRGGDDALDNVITT